ncbi:hypothetical protein [Pelotomaculum propionicicum]|uniref:hypothetical protein n=1 Tax=Pelotomaculum propionicicum TaxID=258475 RepID=UPI003BA16E68
MTRKLRVGVKYCGHCNPYIDGPALVHNLEQLVQNVELVSWDNPTYDVLLMVSACMSACLSRPSFNGPWIEIVVNEIRKYQVTDGSPAELFLKVLLDEGIKAQ